MTNVSGVRFRHFWLYSQGTTRSADVAAHVSRQSKTGSCFVGAMDTWLVVWNIFYFPINIGLLIIPIDVHIFQRGGPTTNQILEILGVSSSSWRYSQMDGLVHGTSYENRWGYPDFRKPAYDIDMTIKRTGILYRIRKKLGDDTKQHIFMWQSWVLFRPMQRCPPPVSSAPSMEGIESTKNTDKESKSRIERGVWFRLVSFMVLSCSSWFG